MPTVLQPILIGAYSGFLSDGSIDFVVTPDSKPFREDILNGFRDEENLSVTDDLGCSTFELADFPIDTVSVTNINVNVRIRVDDPNASSAILFQFYIGDPSLDDFAGSVNIPLDIVTDNQWSNRSGDAALALAKTDADNLTVVITANATGGAIAYVSNVTLTASVLQRYAFRYRAYFLSGAIQFGPTDRKSVVTESFATVDDLLTALVALPPAEIGEVDDYAIIQVLERDWDVA